MYKVITTCNRLACWNKHRGRRFHVEAVRRYILHPSYMRLYNMPCGDTPGGARTAAISGPSVCTLQFRDLAFACSVNMLYTYPED